MTAETNMTRGIYRRQYSGYLTGRRICEVSLEAEAWFWRLHAVADDFGNLVADPMLLRNATAGRRDATVEQVQKWVGELVTAKLVRRYSAGGEDYLHLIGFTDYQPAGKNGKRIRRFPGESNADPGESGGIRVNPGESKIIPVCDVQSSASDTDTDTDTEDHTEKKTEGVLFDRFWSAYPSHPRKQAREKCRKLWKSRNLDTQAQTILKALEAWKTHWAKDGNRFVKTTHGWLNDEFWKNPPQPEDAPDYTGPDAPFVEPTEEQIAIAFGEQR